MANHACEEDRVEPWEGALETGDKTPVQGKVEITSVVDLAGQAIFFVDHVSILDTERDRY